MERLTQERGDRTWRWFHIGWYINFACVLAVLVFEYYLFCQLPAVTPDVTGNPLFHTVIMMGLGTIAAVLLIGAGMSRYQARLEGQHLEIKLAINRIQATLDECKSKKEKE